MFNVQGILSLRTNTVNVRLSVQCSMCKESFGWRSSVIRINTPIIMLLVVLVFYLNRRLPLINKLLTNEVVVAMFNWGIYLLPLHNQEN